MEITLTPELENLISEKVKSGKFNSASELIQVSLSRMFKEESIQKGEKQRKLENLRREIQQGIDEIRSGNYRSYNSADEMMEDIIQEARAEFEAKKKNGKKI